MQGSPELSYGWEAVCRCSGVLCREHIVATITDLRRSLSAPATTARSLPLQQARSTIRTAHALAYLELQAAHTFRRRVGDISTLTLV